MWISKSKYETMQNNHESQLNGYRKEIKKLTDIISGKTTDCQVGPWCEGCKYCAVSLVQYDYLHENYYYGMDWIREKSENEIMYCKKYINKICPEFIKE